MEGLGLDLSGSGFLHHATFSWSFGMWHRAVWYLQCNKHCYSCRLISARCSFRSTWRSLNHGCCQSSSALLTVWDLATSACWTPKLSTFLTCTTTELDQMHTSGWGTARSQVLWASRYPVRWAGEYSVTSFHCRHTFSVIGAELNWWQGRNTFRCCKAADSHGVTYHVTLCWVLTLCTRVGWQRRFGERCFYVQGTNCVLGDAEVILVMKWVDHVEGGIGCRQS